MVKTVFLTIYLHLQAYQEAVQSKRDIREALEEANQKLVHVNSTGPRVVFQSSKNRKVTDTEDTRHKREVQKDGKIVTETSKTTEHEEVTPHVLFTFENRKKNYEISIGIFFK